MESSNQYHWIVLVGFYFFCQVNLHPLGPNGHYLFSIGLLMMSIKYAQKNTLPIAMHVRQVILRFLTNNTCHTQVIFVQWNLLHQGGHHKRKSLSVEVVQRVANEHGQEYCGAVVSITWFSHRMLWLLEKYNILGWSHTHTGTSRILVCQGWAVNFAWRTTVQKAAGLYE